MGFQDGNGGNSVTSADWLDSKFKDIFVYINCQLN